MFGPCLFMGFDTMTYDAIGSVHAARIFRGTSVDCSRDDSLMMGEQSHLRGKIVRLPGARESMHSQSCRYQRTTKLMEGPLDDQLISCEHARQH